MTNITRAELFACGLGIMVGAMSYYFLHTGQVVPLLPATTTSSPHTHDDGQAAHHTHADFHIQIGDQLLDLARPELMTTDTQALHPKAHLHDGVGTVVHFHAPNISFGTFLASLGFSWENECLTTLDNET